MKYVRNSVRRKLHAVLKDRKEVNENPIKRLNIIISGPDTCSDNAAHDDRSKNGLLITLTSFQ